MSAIPIATYSAADSYFVLNTPFGTVQLCSGAGSSDEGLVIEAVEETDTMTIGADGSAMHSLHATNAVKVTVNLLKTSPANAVLQSLYNSEKASPLTFGQDVIAGGNVVTGDGHTCSGVAFARKPSYRYGKEPGIMAWEFNCANHVAILGTGITV